MCLETNMIHIIIPVHNRLHLTKKCLASLDRQSFRDWHAYIVDDGSSDGTYEWVNSLARSDISCIQGDGSLWWTGSMDFGVQTALTNTSNGDFIMSLNNDLVFFSNDAIEILIETTKNNSNSICASLSVADSKNKEVMSSGSKMLSWVLNIPHHPLYGNFYSNITNFNPIEVDMLTGRSVIYPVSVFDNLNRFNFEMFPQYGGDNEFTFRAKKMGHKLFIVPNSVVIVNRSETGINPMDKVLSFREKIESLFSIRSVNNLIIRTRFAMSVPPWYARPTYLIIAFLKIIAQLFLSNLIIKFRK